MISIRNFIALLAAAVFSLSALNAFAAVDVNKASQAELETVKGIGPGLSAKILKAREAGTFKNSQITDQLRMASSQTGDSH